MGPAEPAGGGRPSGTELYAADENRGDRVAAGGRQSYGGALSRSRGPG